MRRNNMETQSYFNRGLNCFGYKKTSPLAIFSDDFEALRMKVRADAVKYLFGEKEAMFDEIEAIAREELARNEQRLNVFDIELLVEHRLHFNQNQNGFIQNRVKERCFRIKEQLVSAIKVSGRHFESSDKLLDVGAGSGLNAQLVKQELGLNYALLTDVVDYRYHEVRNAANTHFQIFKAPFHHIQTDQLFQLGIITNTLHHCDQPFEVFQAMASKMVPGSILLVIESCIGISAREVNDANFSRLIPFQTLYLENGDTDPYQLEYLGLSDPDKMMYGIFFDWLYNRVFLNENINVPYNFGTTEDWNRKFEANGFEVIRTYLMGFDQPAALEFHTLHVLKKRSI